MSSGGHLWLYSYDGFPKGTRFLEWHPSSLTFPSHVPTRKFEGVPPFFLGGLVVHPDVRGWASLKNIVCSLQRLQSRSPSLLWQKTCPKNVQEQWYQTLNLHTVIRLRSTPRFVAWKFLVSVCAGGASCKQPFDRNQKVYQLYHCQARQWRQSGSCFFCKWLNQVPSSLASAC